MNFIKWLKENEQKTVSLHDLYGSFHDIDEHEGIVNVVGPNDFDIQLPIYTLPIQNLSSVKVHGGNNEPVIDVFDNYAESWQKKLVNDYMKQIKNRKLTFPKNIIVMDDAQLIDGNHRFMAYYKLGLPIQYVDLKDLSPEKKSAVLKEMPLLSSVDGDSPSEKDIENRFNSIANRKSPFDVQDNGKFSFVSYNTQMGQKAMFIVDNETQKPVGKVTYNQELTEIPKILNSGVIEAYRGQGLGQQAYELLLKRYGSLSSDKTLSPHSFKLWKRLGDKYEGKTYLAQVANNWGDTNPKITYRLVDDFSLSMLTNPRERFVIKL